MRILIISALFPPDIIGGAETSAHSLCLWLVAQGVEVGVLSVAKSPEKETSGDVVEGYRIWRVTPPRPYQVLSARKAKGWQKPIWHIQDHLDPRNRTIVEKVLDDFDPDLVNIQVLQGLGYNVLTSLSERKIPTVYFLHDLGLACIRMCMFKNDRECAKQCLTCRLSCSYKKLLFPPTGNIAFCSPSTANLDHLSRFFPVKAFRHSVILNPNRYPPASKDRISSTVLRFLYVGRIDATKGVDFLLEVADSLWPKHQFSLTVIGSGPSELSLRARYDSRSWCSFTGFVEQAEVSNYMLNSDLLCVPSVWMENSPGVVVHALLMGLPVIASNKGGIPELVHDGVNGKLVAAGDHFAWKDVMTEVIDDPSLVSSLRAQVKAEIGRFSQDLIGRQTLDFMESVAGLYGNRRSAGPTALREKPGRG